jgi:hypothetical protein
MPVTKMRDDIERWQGIIDWLDEKMATPLTPRDFRRPLVQSPLHRLAHERDKPLS